MNLTTTKWLHLQTNWRRYAKLLLPILNRQIALPEARKSNNIRNTKTITKQFQSVCFWKFLRNSSLTAVTFCFFPVQTTYNIHHNWEFLTLWDSYRSHRLILLKYMYSRCFTNDISSITTTTTSSTSRTTAQVNAYSQYKNNINNIQYIQSTEVTSYVIYEMNYTIKVL